MCAHYSSVVLLTPSITNDAILNLYLELCCRFSAINVIYGIYELRKLREILHCNLVRQLSYDHWTFVKHYLRSRMHVYYFLLKNQIIHISRFCQLGQYAKSEIGRLYAVIRAFTSFKRTLTFNFINLLVPNNFEEYIDIFKALQCIESLVYKCEMMSRVFYMFPPSHGRA